MNDFGLPTLDLSSIGKAPPRKKGLFGGVKRALEKAYGFEGMSTDERGQVMAAMQSGSPTAAAQVRAKIADARQQQDRFAQIQNASYQAMRGRGASHEEAWALSNSPEHAAGFLKSVMDQQYKAGQSGPNGGTAAERDPLTGGPGASYQARWRDQAEQPTFDGGPNGGRPRAGLGAVPPVSVGPTGSFAITERGSAAGGSGGYNPYAPDPFAFTGGGVPGEEVMGTPQHGRARWATMLPGSPLAAGRGHGTARMGGASQGTAMAKAADGRTIYFDGSNWVDDQGRTVR